MPILGDRLQMAVTNTEGAEGKVIKAAVKQGIIPAGKVEELKEFAVVSHAGTVYSLAVTPDGKSASIMEGDV